jgi:low temperature requirement protein LtrA
MPGTDGEKANRVTTLELFFDLVFVFTLTQLTALLESDASPRGVAHVLLIFAVLWWMYAAYAWLTNAAPPDRLWRRVLLIVAMAGFLVAALAVPRAYRDGGLAFGLGYLLVVLVHAGLYARIHPGATLRFGSLNVLSAGLVIAAGLLGTPTGYGLWAAAVLVQFFTPRLIRLPDTGLRVRTGHFVERHGLLLLIALGESVVAIGVGTAGQPLDLARFGAVTLGLALAAGLWWSYFTVDEGAAERALADTPPRHRVLRAINGYFYAFAPMLLGIVAVAAGVGKTIEHLSDRLDPRAALLLGVGMAVYLAGEGGFRRVMRIGSVGNRLLAAGGCVASVFLGVTVSALAQLLALVGIVLAMLLADGRRTATARIEAVPGQQERRTGEARWTGDRP